MLVTYALIVFPSAAYFVNTFPVATILEQVLALTLLPGLFTAFTLTACSDPGVVRADASYDRPPARAGDDEALAGVSSSGIDFSSSSNDAEAMVDEDVAAQRRATMTSTRGAAAPDLSASYGFRQTIHEKGAAAATSARLAAAGLSAFRRARPRPGKMVVLEEGQALPEGFPALPRGTEWCYDCEVWVHDCDHHCPWTGQCIARDNTVAFYTFLVLTFASLIFVMTSGFVRAIKAPRRGRRGGIRGAAAGAPLAGGPSAVSAAATTAAAAAAAGDARPAAAFLLAAALAAAEAAE